MRNNVIGSRAVPIKIEPAYERMTGEALNWQSKLDATGGDSAANFALIRTTKVDRLNGLTYHEHETMTGKRYTVTAFNQLPKRTYPIVLPVTWLD